MTTRLSKIARLPAKTREQLNRRLHNGELGRTILPWVNNLPKTKQVLADIFNAKPITHQNLSEWRATGYQDWLFHQQRLDWFSRLEEEDKEISKHDGCGDTYEAMSRFFLFEIGQAMRDAQKIKNPDARWERLERLTDKFARLQNSYNWSRRCQLEYDKYNHQFEPDDQDQLDDQDQPDAGGASVPANRPPNEHPDGSDDALETGDRARPGRSETSPRVSHLRSNSSESLVPPHAPDVRREAHRTAAEAAALQDAPRDSEAKEQRASIPDCDSPLPLSNSETQPPNQSPAAPTTSDAPRSETNSQTPELVPPPRDPRPSFLAPPNCHPIPTPPPTTPFNRPTNPQVIEPTNSIRKTLTLYPARRVRGFTCVEG